MGYLLQSQKERVHEEDQDAVRWIILWDGMDWVDLAQDWHRWGYVVNTVMNLWAQVNCRNVVSSCSTGGFSRTAQPREVSTQSGKTSESHNIGENFDRHLFMKSEVSPKEENVRTSDTSIIVTSLNLYVLTNTSFDLTRVQNCVILF